MVPNKEPISLLVSIKFQTLKINFLISLPKLCYWYSKESYEGDGVIEHHIHMLNLIGRILHSEFFRLVS